MNTRDPPRPPKGPRKPYRRPVLENYGTIRNITKITAGISGKNDTVQTKNKTGLF
jgi:hypothetical protein